MPRFIDLHTHTTASDGTDSPAQLVGKALDLDLAALGITDHDTIDGLEEAGQAAQGTNLEIIRGCELSVEESFGELHILGLWIPKAETELQTLKKALALAREKRNTRNICIIEKLNILGVGISYDQVLEEAHGKVIGRPHIAKALLKNGYIENENQAFARYLRYDAPAFVPKTVISSEEGVRMLADLGATVSLAHPILVRCPRSILEERIAALRDYGLTAIEAWHAEHKQADIDYIKALAKRLGLAVSGGTDYHGCTKPDVRLGQGKGGMRISEQVLDQLKEQRHKLGLPI